MIIKNVELAWCSKCQTHTPQFHLNYKNKLMEVTETVCSKCNSLLTKERIWVKK